MGRSDTVAPHDDAERALGADEEARQVVARPNDLTVRVPVWSRVPSASTTSSPRTASRVTPYLRHRSPPALVAMLPPMVLMAALAGSGAYRSPSGGGGLVEPSGDHARLDHGDAVLGAELDDAVEPGEVEDDGVRCRNGSPCHACARSPGDDGNASLSGASDNVLDLTHRRWPRYRERQLARRPGAIG